MPKTLLNRLFPHDLKLMVDYCLDPKSIDEINKLGSVKAKRTTDLGFRPNATDKELVYNDKGCVLLTNDFRTIDEKIYPPCQHEGIIILKEKRPSAEKIVNCIKAFAQSGHRKLTSHNVIHLWEKKAIVHKHHKVTEEIEL